MATGTRMASLISASLAAFLRATVPGRQYGCTEAPGSAAVSRERNWSMPGSTCGRSRAPGGRADRVTRRAGSRSRAERNELSGITRPGGGGVIMEASLRTGSTGDLVMPRYALVCSYAALLLAAFGSANAQNAFTSRPMNVRAGPNREYPLVAQLGSGAPLDVRGCLSDWSWCDASFDGNRGWIYAGGLSFDYQGGRVPLYSYGPSLGLPIVTFSLPTYWNDYYRGRPWYAQRSVWAHRPMPPHRRPRGRPHAGPPPVPRGGQPAFGRPGARGGERGHAAPARRDRPLQQHGAERPQRAASPQPRSTHGAHPQGRESSRGNSAHGERGSERSKDAPR
ncbi:MAG: SH3 domain-containing protein [Steroidobacteraceae bacterium]